MLVFQCCHFSKQFLSNLSKIKYLAFFITLCFVVSLAKMVTPTNNFVYQKSAQYRKHIWSRAKYKNRWQSQKCFYSSLSVCPVESWRITTHISGHTTKQERHFRLTPFYCSRVQNWWLHTIIGHDKKFELKKYHQSLHILKIWKKTEKAFSSIGCAVLNYKIWSLP